MRRGLIIIASVFLLGAITTLATAWALAAWGRTDGDGPRSSGAFIQWDRAWNITRVPHFGVRVHWWSAATDNEEPIRSTAAFLRALTPPRPPAEIVAQRQADLIELSNGGRTRWPISVDNQPPPWGAFAASAAPTDHMGSDTAFGWPAPCLWYQVTAGFNRVTMSTTNDTLRGGILLRGSPESRAGTFRALPLRPIWWGLSLNTLVFAMLWGLLLLAPPAARRAIRRRRGRCPRCGYDLAGQSAPGCPECGAGRA